MSVPRDAEDPLLRLSRAVDVFLEHCDGESREVLLSRHDDLRDLLEPMLEPGHGLAAGVPDHTRYLGDFRLVREIGRGGMGVVYEAEEVSLGRRVALKVLPAHVTLSPSQVERFRREASAAARLHHPGIVPIHSVGSHGGAHFFAMELVEGRDLGEALERVKSGAASNLGVVDEQSFAAEAAEVIAQAAEALHHAHLSGVIHRDIKPQNILIGSDRKVRLVDFGLAKDLDRKTLSRTGEFAGTPRYVSPEQALGTPGQVDHRTDVFSLGVVLYEILAHRGPFEADSTQQELSAVVVREPVSLRKCNARVPLDLEIICHKALEKKPDHRYATAAAFAADLRRFLRHEPIQATRPSLFSRALKLVRRRRAWTAAMVVGLLLSAGALALWMRGTSKEAEAQRHLASARTALDQLADVVGSLNERPGASAPYLARVEELVTMYDELITSSNDPEVRREACRAYNLAGDAYESLGRREEFGAVSTRAVALARGLVKDFPDTPQYRYELARSYFNRSLARDLHDVPASRQADLDASIELFEELDRQVEGNLLKHSKRGLAAAYVSSAANMRMAAPGAAPRPAARKQLERALSLIAELPEVWRDREPRALYELAHVHVLDNELDQAIELGEKAVASGEDLLQQAIKVRAVLVYALIPALRLLGSLYATVGDDRAVPTLHRATDLASTTLRSIALEPHTARARDVSQLKSQLAKCRFLLAKAHWKKGENDDGRELADDALRGITELVQRSPERADFLAIRAEIRVTAATRAMRSGAPPSELEIAFAGGLADYRVLVESRPRATRYLRDLGAALSNLATVHLRLGKIDSACRHAEEAIAVQSRAIESNPHERRCRTFLATHYRVLLTCLGRREDHRRIADAADEYARRFNDNSHAQRLAVRYLCRCVDLARPDAASARGYGERAVRILRSMVDSGMTRSATLARSSEFASLRDLDSFRALIEEK